MKKVSLKNFFVSFSKPEEKLSSGFALVSRYRGAILGLATLWILEFHVMNAVFGLDTPIREMIEYRIKRYGYCGVDIFLLLSGMGLTYAIDKTKGLLKLPVFFYRRIKRIALPALAIALIHFKLDGWSFEWFLSCISGKAFYTVSMYSYLWFVPAIMTLYVCFPLYWLGFKKLGPYFWTSTMLLAWFFLILIFRNKIRGDLYGFFNRIPVFMLGILLGHLTETKKDMPFRRRAYFPVFVLMAFGFYLMEITNFQDFFLVVPTSNCFLPTLTISLSLPFLLAKLLNEMECRRFLCIPGKIINGLLKFFALFSMEMYCLQEWYKQVRTPKLMYKELTKLQMNLVLFLEITAISFVSYLVFKYFWKLVELPYTLMKKKKAGKQSAAVTG